MKVSYKILKKHLPFLESPENTAKALIMHTAEVEEIHSQSTTFDNIVFWRITEIQPHENADSLKVCKVDVGESEDLQIVCWGSNLSLWQGVAVAKIWASVIWHGQWDPVVMKKTSIRWVESSGMICASEEIGLKDEFPAKDEKEILDISFIDAANGTPLATILGKDDFILIIDNKAINHRPDMFSYMGVMRELCVIYRQAFPLSYENIDFSKNSELKIENQIPEVVKRYIWLQVEGVKNSESPEHIKSLVEAAGNTSKGILIDITNYSLFMYGQPTHCFDADKIEGNIVIRFAKNWEKILALDNKEYELWEDDIVIADGKKVIAIAWVIGGKETAVSETTTKIIIESAFFPWEVVRRTWRKLWVRTDALNIFEKNIPLGLQDAWVSLIYSNLKEVFSELKTVAYNDLYPKKETTISIPYSLDFINALIGKKYDEKEAIEILKLLWIEILDGNCIIPFWRKDMSKKADIAEEICRIDGFENVIPTTPRIDVWAVVQSNMVKLKWLARTFFSSIGFFDMYNYSFVNEALMKKLLSSTQGLIEMKNYLSEEVTHMRDSLIPNLMLWIEQNIRERDEIKMFELEKVFWLKSGEVYEAYHLAGVITTKSTDAYYPTQEVLLNFFSTIWVDKVSFEKPQWEMPSFAHSWRIADVLVRGKKIWYICEVKKEVCENFDVRESRVWCFEVNADILSQTAFNIPKTQELSAFQENNFDISFVVDKKTKGIDIQNKIKKADPAIIQKVELFDIYEDAEKLPWKRSLSFKIHIQSQSWTLGDEVKNTLIKKIISEVEKVGGKLR